MFHTGINRAKYDVGQGRAMQRDRDLERQSIAMVEAALSCCMTEEKKAKCNCKHTDPVPAVGDFIPLLVPEEDNFAPYRKGEPPQRVPMERKASFQTMAPVRGQVRTAVMPRTGFQTMAPILDVGKILGPYRGGTAGVRTAVMPKMGTPQSQRGWRSTAPRGRPASTNGGSIFVRT